MVPRIMLQPTHWFKWGYEEVHDLCPASQHYSSSSSECACSGWMATVKKRTRDRERESKQVYTYNILKLMLGDDLSDSFHFLLNGSPKMRLNMH